ncbi:STAS domain-containing protein [Nonomuraea sp. NEAU-A123]|uniref:STAS domain-containing protein n=1 Tax=Nonomuraea sp. NEAU-A123 TaxID=2839649 RepID=UPI001BE4B436|nr:STAS domain-containing protein [Nonomuraea sp. NEAU-A123]MBT2227264.1 STAS domain-containing protein [Nonomuraea sp. NEAU-A123]
MFLSVRLTTVSATVVVIHLTGELDSTTAPVLAATLEPLTESPVEQVIVAAGDLWFCDLTGIDELAATHRALHAKGGGLAVAEAGASLCRLIELVTEHSRAPMRVYATLDEALTEAGVHPEDPLPPARRHLPRLRRLPRAQPARADRRPRWRPDPAPPSATAAESGTHLTRVCSAIARAHALREQAATQVEALKQRTHRYNQVWLTMLETRARCLAAVTTMRANRARAALTLSANAGRGNPG